MGEDTVAFPFEDLALHQVLETTVDGIDVVALWESGTQSSLDADSIANSADVGSAGVFIPSLDGQRLTFKVRNGKIVDVETGSVWNVLGHAVEGPREGARLQQVVSANHLWFAWSIFKPETRIIRG